MNTTEDQRIERSADDRRRDDGFTLIEILIAIVLVGILSAVAVVGISNLVGKGSSSACSASRDSATAASAVYFASTSAYPTNFNQMTSNGALVLPSGVTVNTAIIPAATPNPAIPVGLQASSGTSWYLTMTPGTSTVAPTFVCS
jgi:prepilin-type N-terminal cleavage/methylation domain-containing protein